MAVETSKEQQNMENDESVYDILRQEHKDVKKLFRQIVDENRYQDNVYVQIKNALVTHIAEEEKLFYPRLEKNAVTRPLILEAYEQHDVEKKVINDIDNSADKDAKLAKVKVLSGAIDQHIAGEEGDLFKKAKKVLSSQEEREIARDFVTEKTQNIPRIAKLPTPTNIPNM